MRWLPRRLALIALLPCATAQAGIVFTPHLSEYAVLPPGQYTELTAVYTEIEDSYDRNGNKVPLGAPFVKPGDSVDASLLLLKYLWVGNIFRDSGVPILSTRPQFCRVIGVLGHQQATGGVVARSRLFGLNGGASGFGDLFGLCGIYTHEHTWGPLKANGLFGTTVKAPVGRFDQDALVNPGTDYWSVIPQFAWHADLFGRLIMDGTVAYQFKGNSDSPAYGGLTPTRPADFFNIEQNFAWKWSEHWYTDLGISYRRSIGPNRFDKVTVNFQDQPLPPTSACDDTNSGLGVIIISPELCNSLEAFYLNPRSGPYEDRGVYGLLATAGLYYIYRASTVLQARVAVPIEGRGSQIDITYDVCANQPCGPNNAFAQLTPTINGVQEAAAVSASPYFELRMVYLFWAP